jgi:hypothetical protein
MRMSNPHTTFTVLCLEGPARLGRAFVLSRIKMRSTSITAAPRDIHRPPLRVSLRLSF